MARPRSPNRKRAFDLYKRYDGKISNVKIAQILECDNKTVSKWKTLDKWEEELKKQKKDSKNRGNPISYDYNVLEERTLDMDSERVLYDSENIDELTEKQTLFCIYYVKSFNATKAYMKAYGGNFASSAACASRLLKDVKIQNTIKELKNNKMNQALLTQEDIFQKYIDIAFADITDFVTFGNKSVTYYDKQGNEHDTIISYVDINESKEVDGTLVSEVSQGKEGVKVKLADRMKALQWLTDHMDMLTIEQRTRVESLNNKMRIESENMELRKKEYERDDW